MRNKAFVAIDADQMYAGNPPGFSCVARYVILDETDAVVSGTSAVSISVAVEYADNSQTVCEKIADLIRSNTDDATLIVVFLGSPGRF